MGLGGLNPAGVNLAGLSHAAPAFLAAFLASLVECVEALTVILAVGTVRGWGGALAGLAAGLAVLVALVAGLGRALALAPLGLLQLLIGVLLLLFGLRWLRKAVLRAAGVIPLHDEAAIFARQAAQLGGAGAVSRIDPAGFAAAFQITLLEGVEVVFIVIAVGAGAPGLIWPASYGALAALAVVAALGVIAHRPLANVPENTLKFTVGVLLSAFGTFWCGEGLGVVWPGADWAIPGLVAGFLIAALVGVRLCKAARAGVAS